ncbi:MAG: YCF48-related protein, partial [bacterium]
TPGFTIHSMNFLNENSGWITGDAGYILRTTDGGNRWDSLISNTHSGLKSIQFINNDTGFAVGYNGLILRTTNGGGPGFPVGIKEFSSESPEGFYLSQNFPNPFNPKTIINYTLSAPQGGSMFSYVQLKIYDMLGNEVATLVNERKSPGSYSVEFDGADFSSGIYFIKLRQATLNKSEK